MALKIPSVKDAIALAQDSIAKRLNGAGKDTKGLASYASEINLKTNSQSTKYLVRIACSDLGIFVVGALPESIALNTASQFGEPFSDLNPFGAKVTGAMTALMGTTAMTQEQTISIWQSSNHIEMSLPIQFMAKYDPREEIIRPLLDLYELHLPSGPDGKLIMTAPGPTIDVGGAMKKAAGSAIDGIKDFLLSDLQLPTNEDEDKKLPNFDKKADGSFENQISIRIGNFMYFDNVVVTGVDANFDSLISSDPFGTPLKAQITVNFKTLYVATIEDMYRIFLAQGIPTRATAKKGAK